MRGKKKKENEEGLNWKRRNGGNLEYSKNEKDEKVEGRKEERGRGRVWMVDEE